MPTQIPSRVFRASARGRQHYIDARHKLANSILEHRQSLLGPANKYLTEALFKLRKDKWIILNFSSKDWPILAHLLAARDAAIEANYQQLVTDYIISNSAPVNQLYDASLKISAAVLRDDGDTVTSIFNNFDRTDRQSIFSFRTYISQRVHSNELLVDYFEREMSTDWLKKRFLYPFIYYFINNPADRYWDTFLSYVSSAKSFSERQAIKLLLCDEVSYDHTASFKYYIAMLCHPFDACEIVINHFELEFIRSGKLSFHATSSLEMIAQAIPTPRVLALRRLITKAPLKFTSVPSEATISKLFALDERTGALLKRFSDISADDEFSDVNLSRPLAALARMRRDRYPSIDDFNVLTNTASHWRFTDAGRLLSALLASIFMVSRREPNYEARLLCRLCSYFGGLNPFILSSPSGPWAIDCGILPVEIPYAEMEALCDSFMKSANECKSRLWIKAVHWTLRNPERERHVSRWLDIVRRDIRVSPGFLTGINWQWVDEVIRIVRLTPFRGRSSGIYALLLMQIEERQRDNTFLRSAIEPLAKERTFFEFVEWLIFEYRGEAIAFARYFLSAENILLLRLAPNYTAAISLRIIGIETCVRKFGFGSLLDEPRFNQETKALTTALLLTTVSAGQFEIPWDSFRKDIQEKEADTYATYASFVGTGVEASVLGKGRVSVPHLFRNGKTVMYEFENHYWPLVTLLLSIIDGFIEHPLFGIEVILSTRFRHDTMRREYARVLSDAKGANIAGVLRPTQAQIVDAISARIYGKVSVWLNWRLQTDRPGHLEALFNFAPAQEEVGAIIKCCHGFRDFDKIVSYVCDWLQQRLDAQVATARGGFLDELAPALQKEINDDREEMLRAGRFRPEDVMRVSGLVSTVVADITERVSSWFRTGDAKNRRALTVHEMKAAADGVFETQIAKGELSARLKKCPQAEYCIAPEKVRLCFDLLCELFANAVRYGRGPIVQMKIWPCRQGALSGFVFSTLINDNDRKDYSLPGHRYELLNDAIFREGNSGLRKIAALSASLVEEDIELEARADKRVFRVFVPLVRIGDNADVIV